ncbi:7929_t:CDS:2 [Entrophospora sp. SA101]|nr:7929_t:CDS:2 [Entrophospora sp. SA101]
MSTRLQRTADKSLNEKHAKILKDCLQKPENKNCADCKRKDPRWASWNLGIFVCINCSGVHRSMGTHISRVKSVDLDNWTPEQVEGLEALLEYAWSTIFIHNKVKVHSRSYNIDSIIQRYWEANLKNSKPSERSKYEAKKWAMSGPIPDPDTFNDNAYLSESTSEKTLEKTSREEIKNEKSPKIQNKENNTFDLFMSAPQSSSSNNVSSQQHQQKNSSKLHGSEFFSIGKQSTFTALDSKNLMIPQGGQYFTTFSSSSQQSLSNKSISSPTIETKPSSKHNE